MNRGRILVFGAGAVVLLVVVTAAWILWPRGTTEVSEQDALDDFHERVKATTSMPPSDDNDSETDDEPSNASPTVPAAGVFTYRASGQEVVKLGPLPAETRPLPDSVTAIVVDDGDGCFELTINFFAEHTEDTRYCVSASGAITLESHVKHQRIGALSPTATMTCDPGLLVDPAADATTLDCHLDMTGGPVAITATLVGSATTAATVPLVVADEVVPTTPLTIAYEVTGDLTGTWTETLWLGSDLLPIRIERTLELSGPATFSEHSELELIELSPAT